MRAGNFESAWQFSDEVLKLGLNRDYQNLPRHYQCIWDGTPLHNKRVFIRCYHGLGDTIQFIRYAPMLKAIAGEVIVWVQPTLTDLLKTTDGIDQLMPLHDGTPEIEYDADIEIMELPHYFRTTLSTIPATVPYIHVVPLPLPGKNKRRVALVWQAGDWDQSRNIPFDQLKPLFEIEGTDFYILQANAQTAGWEPGSGIYPGEFSVDEFAAILKSMDLLITVDSMPAHLAGALNVPVWVLIKKHADWRWMENRSDSPWYPSMKLFRQATPGDWKEPIQEITEALKQ